MPGRELFAELLIEGDDDLNVRKEHLEMLAFELGLGLFGDNRRQWPRTRIHLGGSGSGRFAFHLIDPFLKDPFVDCDHGLKILDICLFSRENLVDNLGSLFLNESLLLFWGEGLFFFGLFVSGSFCR